MDREWREASDLRSSLIGIGLVMVAGGLLRYWNLRHAPVSAFETQIIVPVVQLLHTGSYRPESLTQPTLPIYLQALVAIVHFIWGATIGTWRSVGDFDSAQILTWGRGFSALIGTAVVFIVYQIGMHWGARHALFAAGLMAVSPTHVAASREMAGGSPLTFFAALTLRLSITAIERGRRGRFIIAGAAAGLGAACHYAGALLVMLPLVAAWMTLDDQDSRASRSAAVIAAGLAAFVGATPLSVGDLPAFLNGLAFTASPAAFTMPDSLGRVELLRWLVSTLQWPGVILGFTGLGLGIARAVTGPGHTRWTLLVSFPLVYFALVGWHGATRDAVLLPLVPAATVLAAIAVISGVSLLRRFDIPRAARTALIAALTVAAVLPPAVNSIELVRQASREMAGVSAPTGRGR